ncbi:hypothetical protein BDV25DRAFT_163163 [Aspergillus avenaceus]|uniref:Uncharacterized protein n=1 Tax=Aspergillus avenaceus TaxID=36643 RepID=A0A5N6TIB1_ASPAV|nr:hypothetical protein BDV25DRAFT_163163 [Aspergillus avenaceus]
MASTSGFPKRKFLLPIVCTCEQSTERSLSLFLLQDLKFLLYYPFAFLFLFFYLSFP